MHDYRPSSDHYFLGMAVLVSSRGTCIRRRVGCVLVNSLNHVLATGYNGPASGQDHCLDNPCKGSQAPSGQGLELCEAVHAEQNALLQCRNVQEIEAIYCTTAPCVTCVKLLMNTSAKRLVFLQDYPHSEESRRLWEKSGRRWLNLEDSFAREPMIFTQLVTKKYEDRVHGKP